MIAQVDHHSQHRCHGPRCAAVTSAVGSAWDDEPHEPRRRAVLSSCGMSLIVGGSLDEWNALGDAAWRERILEFGKVAEHAGATWLTIRPLDRVDAAARRRCRLRSHASAAAPVSSIRRPMAGNAWSRRSTCLRRDGRPVTDANLAEVVNAPAPCDPDLAIIVGPDTDLPSTLVWELAYCELVYLDVPWVDLRGERPGGCCHRVRRTAPTLRRARLWVPPSIATRPSSCAPTGLPRLIASSC